MYNMNTPLTPLKRGMYEFYRKTRFNKSPLERGFRGVYLYHNKCSLTVKITNKFKQLAFATFINEGSKTQNIKKQGGIYHVR